MDWKKHLLEFTHDDPVTLSMVTCYKQEGQHARQYYHEKIADVFHRPWFYGLKLVKNSTIADPSDNFFAHTIKYF